ncbi:MAG: hypothetical protein ABIZ34_03090 [Candidatus Limnocylindrales bacterium]
MIRLGIADEGWQGFEREIAKGVAAAASERGWEWRTVTTADDEAAVDIVLAIGNVGIYPDLIRRTVSARRVLWHMETLPIEADTSGIANALHRHLPTGRMLDISARMVPLFGRSHRFALWREEAARERETGTNLRQLRAAQHALDRIVVDTHDRAAGALAAGIPVAVEPVGYHEAFAGPIAPASVSAPDRDIPALMLGSLPGSHGRRHRLLPIVEAGLASRGVALVRVTGNAMGAERRAILERTRVVVDVQRVAGNHPMLRFILAAAAGAALACEPLYDPRPLVPGVHYLEATTEDLPRAVEALLRDEAARTRIVDAAQTLIAGPAHLRIVLPRVLATIGT